MHPEIHRARTERFDLIGQMPIAWAQGRHKRFESGRHTLPVKVELTVKYRAAKERQ